MAQRLITIKVVSITQIKPKIIQLFVFKILSVSISQIKLFQMLSKAFYVKSTNDFVWTS